MWQRKQKQMNIPTGQLILNSGTEKKTFSHIKYQHTQTPNSINILQDTLISNTSVSSEHSNFTKGRKVKIFSQKLGKTNQQTHNFRCFARLQYSLYCWARTKERPKSSNNVTKRNRIDRPGDQRYAEQGCDFSSKNREDQFLNSLFVVRTWGIAQWSIWKNLTKWFSIHTLRCKGCFCWNFQQYYFYGKACYTKFYAYTLDFLQSQ